MHELKSYGLRRRSRRDLYFRLTRFTVTGGPVQVPVGCLMARSRAGSVPCPCSLPRHAGGSASTTSLSRPAQALHALRVAVGTAVAPCPPHSPVLALLAHTVPTLDV